MKVKDSKVYQIVKNGMIFDQERKIYLFNDIINKDEKLMDKLFHLDFEIDDYYYEFLAECLAVICEKLDEEEDLESVDIDSLRDDILSEIEADIYTANLTAWLNSRPDKVYYLSEVLEEFGGDLKDGFQLLSLAQLKEKEVVYEIGFEFVRQLIEEELEEGESTEEI